MTDDDLAPDDRKLLDELADAIVKRRLTSAAIFFLESMKPMNFVGSQTMILLRPLVILVWPQPARWDQLQRVLEQRGTIELLLLRLEARA